MSKIDFVGKCLLVGGVGEKILAVGDLHLGYEEYLNQGGVFVSRKLFEEMIGELDEIFSQVGVVDRVVLLGDVKHHFAGILRQEWNDVLSLLDYLEGRCREITIVKGNHDNILEPIVRKRKRVRLVNYLIEGEFCFLHGDKDFPESYSSGVKYWIVGHGHPAVKISDGVKVEKFKCFLSGKFRGREIIVVPSFASHSVGSDPRENGMGLAWKFNLEKFEVFVVGFGLEVFGFGRLGDLY